MIESSCGIIDKWEGGAVSSCTDTPLLFCQGCEQAEFNVQHNADGFDAYLTVVRA